MADAAVIKCGPASSVLSSLHSACMDAVQSAWCSLGKSASVGIEYLTVSGISHARPRQKKRESKGEKGFT